MAVFALMYICILGVRLIQLVLCLAILPTQTAGTYLQYMVTANSL